MLEHRTRIRLLAFVFFLVSAGQVHAAFSDNFDTENSGFGSLIYNSFANWNVTAGSVDLIGNGYYDFYPGNGLYVDLNGSTGVSGTLATKAYFTPGTYNLSFAIGNNPTNGLPNMMTVSLGSYHETFTETGTVPLQIVSRLITLTSSAQLIFATPATDADNFGVIIDNVSLNPAIAVPEPKSFAMMALGLLLAGIFAPYRALLPTRASIDTI